MLQVAQPSKLNHVTSLVDRARKQVERIPLSVPQLLARLAVANVFWRSGQTKLASWDQTIQLFQDEYHVPVLPPELAAAVSATFELGCSALIALGLLSRLATLPLLGMVLVIQLFVYPQNWPDHLMWTALLVFILARGPGQISLDALLGSAFKRYIRR